MPSPGQRRQQPSDGVGERHTVCGAPGLLVVKGRYVVSKSAMDTGKKILALQGPDKMMVHHALHHFTQVTDEADCSVTRCQGVVSSRFWNKCYINFFPGISHQVLRPYTIVYGQQKCPACGWRVGTILL
jgi:hypothetical protein